MSSSNPVDYYYALEATTRVEDITEDEGNQETLRSLKDGGCYHLDICSRDIFGEDSDFDPRSSEELGWLGHFAKKSVHLDQIGFCGSDIFNNCSEQSVKRFFDDIGKCNRIKQLYIVETDLNEIIDKLDAVINNNSENITHLCSHRCNLEVPTAKHLFNFFRGMRSLQEISVSNDEVDGLDDDDMAVCIPSLEACTGVQELKLEFLGLGFNSCAALSIVFPRMNDLLKLDLSYNSIDHDCVQVLVRGLVECRHLHELDISNNFIGDDELEMLIQGLPTSVDTLYSCCNGVTLARQLPLLRFKELYLEGNELSPVGPRVIAISLANPECRLERLNLYQTGVGDDGAATIAESLINNKRLVSMTLSYSYITETGWYAFSSVLCNAASINATHGSNHTLQHLGGSEANIPQEIQTILKLNCGKDKNRVAATKILQTHHHLNMRPLFDLELDLLPYVISWQGHYAEYCLRLKLSLIFQFVQAMPMNVIERRDRSSLNSCP